MDGPVAASRTGPGAEPGVDPPATLPPMRRLPALFALALGLLAAIGPAVGQETAIVQALDDVFGPELRDHGDLGQRWEEPAHRHR
jgi:hypothetical protein